MQFIKIITTNLVNIITKRFIEKPKIFGRWNREISQSQLIRRIELANEDHCGPCGGAEIKKILK